MNTCSNCDKIILSDYKFCPRCGLSIYGNPPAGVNPAESPAVPPVTPSPVPVSSCDDNSIKFFNVAQNLSNTEDIDMLLSRIGKSVEEILSAERSSIMLLDDTGKFLYFKVASGEDILKKLKIPVGTGVAGWIAENKKPDIVNDPYSDSRFSPDTDKKTGFVTKSIVGAPMIAGNEMIGIIEAINKKDGNFTETDKETLIGFAGLAAVMIVNTRLKSDQKNIFSNLIDFLVIGSEALGGPEPSPHGHAWEMARLIPSIGRELNLTRERIQLLHNAALLHDIGFLGLANPELLGINISREISEESKYIIHPVIGAEMVKGIKAMKDLGPIILYHHKYIDGTGFPEKLATENITMDSEIIAILEEYSKHNSIEKISTEKYSKTVYDALTAAVE